MIWALLEITLPLCLSFLFGLCAGWLFWRWRRRSISQADWDSHGKADAESLNSLNDANRDLQATTDNQANQLLESEKTISRLNDDLADAKNKLVEQSQLSYDLQQDNKQTESLTAERDSALAKVKELEQKLENDSYLDFELEGTSEESNTAAQERDAALAEVAVLEQKLSQQSNDHHILASKLKETENVAAERDSAIAKLKQVEENQAPFNSDDNELVQTRTQLETLDQKFKDFQASVVASRQTSEDEKQQLKDQIERLQAELEKGGTQAPGGESDQQRIRQLESQLLQAGDTSSELSQAKANIANLDRQLNQAKLELARKEQTQPQAENTDENQKAAELARQNNELSNQLQQARREADNLREAQSKLAEVTAQLNNARARNNQLTAVQTQANRTAATPVTSIDVGKIKKLQNQIAEKDELIATLQKKAKTKQNKAKSTKPKAAKPKLAKPKAAKSKPKKRAWQQGETKLGTPGCDHKDDLTAINGIGPKIQKVLNRLGIKSWEQLAALKAAEIKLVDEALVDFSGRIKRDEWVPQAKAIIRNGHQPLDPKPRTTKKPKKSKSRKASWQKGKTKFGTVGSIHRDDLKVINGIGPVIEKSLNRSGIRSWEQLAALKVKEVKVIDEALKFPGRIQREQWVQQARALVKQFPDNKDRPTRRTFLNQAAAG